MAHSSPPADPAGRPPLRSLEIVCAVARSGSLTAAAETVGITHGAASRHVKAVEAWLGFRLFDRHGRGVRLTEDGQRFLTQVERGFLTIESAADRWRLRRGAEVVRVSVTPTFARYWLLRRVRALEAGSPKLRLEILAESGFADVDRGEADVAVRYVRRVHADESMAPLMSETLFPVACAELAEDLGPDPSPEAILSRPLLHDADATKWRAWCDATMRRHFRPSRLDRRFEDYALTLIAAGAGLGIALGQSPVADQRLVELGLRRLTPISAPSPFGYYLVEPSGQRRPALTAFRERLHAEIAAAVDAGDVTA